MSRKPPCKYGRRKNGRCPLAPKSRKRSGKKASKVGTLLKTTALEQSKCAKNSLRAVMPPGRPDIRIVICCPPSAWSGGRCAVSMKAHAKKTYRV